jgi:copper chaperone CopZ
MTVLELSVPHLGCRRCVRDVTARLRDVPGVQTVTVDAGRSHVTLTGTMALADAVAALAHTSSEARLEVGPGGDTDGATPPWSGGTDVEEAH